MYSVLKMWNFLEIFFIWAPPLKTFFKGVVMYAPLIVVGISTARWIGVADVRYT